MNTMETMQTVTDTQKDEFAQDSYIDKNVQLPAVIVLNHEVRCGYFIPVGTMAKIGWVSFDESQLIEHTFKSRNTEQGVLITSPRILCVPKTDLYQFDAAASKEAKSKVVVGLYNPELKGNPNIKTERLYLVFFLDNDNNFLHTLPLKYAARGANGASFEAHRRAFKSELEACHAIANGIPARPKNDMFHSLGVFSFETKAELVGDDTNNAWACRVVSHQKPSLENWRSYFVGFEDRKDYIWDSLEPQQALGLPQLALSPSLEEPEALTDDL